MIPMSDNCVTRNLLRLSCSVAHLVWNLIVERCCPQRQGSKGNNILVKVGFFIFEVVNLPVNNLTGEFYFANFRLICHLL